MTAVIPAESTPHPGRGGSELEWSQHLRNILPDIFSICGANFVVSSTRVPTGSRKADVNCPSVLNREKLRSDKIPESEGEDGKTKIV